MANARRSLEDRGCGRSGSSPEGVAPDCLLTKQSEVRKESPEVIPQRAPEKDDEAFVLRSFWAMPVKRRAPWGAVSQAVAPDACAATVSAQLQYADRLVGVPNFPAAHTRPNRCAPFLAIFTSDWSTEIRVMFLKHSPQSQKCSSRLLPV